MASPSRDVNVPCLLSRPGGLEVVPYGVCVASGSMGLITNSGVKIHSHSNFPCFLYRKTQEPWVKLGAIRRGVCPSADVHR